MKRTRVYQIARYFGCSSKEIADFAIYLGFDIKGHSSTLSEDQVETVMREYQLKNPDFLHKKVELKELKELKEFKINKPNDLTLSVLSALSANLTNATKQLFLERCGLEQEKKKIPIISINTERCYYSQIEFANHLTKIFEDSKIFERKDKQIESRESLIRAALKEAENFLRKENIDKIYLNTEKIQDYFNEIKLPENVLGLSKDTFITIIVAIIIYFIQYRQSLKREKLFNIKLDSISNELKKR